MVSANLMDSPLTMVLIAQALPFRTETDRQIKKVCVADATYTFLSDLYDHRSLWSYGWGADPCWIDPLARYAPECQGL